MVVEIRPAHPISRLAAPSSASTKASALWRASSETTTVSPSVGGAPAGEVSAAMFPPGGGVVRLNLRRIEAGLARHGKRFPHRLSVHGRARDEGGSVGQCHGLTLPSV